MIFESGLKVLALGAHPDDIELGCGGFIMKLKQQNATLYYIALSKCNNQFSEDEKDTLIAEQKCAAEIIGIDKTTIYDLPNKELPESRREIMDTLNELQAEIEPNMVLIPHLEDPHQDHSTVGKCAIRTFRNRETILQYEILRHGSASFTPDIYVDITEFVEKKIEAIKCYKSQKVKRKFFEEESFRALARTRGFQSGYDFAEGYQAYRIFL